MTADSDYTDAALAQQLARLGVPYLRVYQADEHAPPLDSEALIGALASHSEPRFREALIPLFVCHPELAPLVPRLVDTLESQPALTLRHMYTAAVYLQRLWRETLGIYLGEFAPLPNYFGQSFFGLPSPDEEFGEAGLRALAQNFKTRTGDEWLSAYQAVMDLLLAQLGLEADAAELARVTAPL